MARLVDHLKMKLTYTPGVRGIKGDAFEIGDLVAFKRVGEPTFLFGEVRDVADLDRVIFLPEGWENRLERLAIPLPDLHVRQFTDECATCGTDKMDMAQAGEARFGSKPGRLDEESIRIEEDDCRLCQAVSERADP